MKLSGWARLCTVAALFWDCFSVFNFPFDEKPLELVVWGLLPWTVIVVVGITLRRTKRALEEPARIAKAEEIERIAKKLDEANKGAKPTGAP